MAKRTLLGWVLGGQKLGAGEMSINLMWSEPERSLDDLLRESFSLDSFGIYCNKSSGSIEDQRAMKILQDTVKKASDK